VSEPTYRVDLSHDPGATLPWKATVVRLSDDWKMRTFETSMGREEAFSKALAYVVAFNQDPEPDHSVYLSEDGDLLDPRDGLHSVKS
jgi:hypothetical protein